MSYDPIREGKIAMNIAMAFENSSAGVEVAENAEQNRARSMCMLPRDMRPDKKVFESIGFKFKDIGDDVLYQATMPEGWTLESDGGYWTDLIDEKGRKRGNYFYKGSFYDRKGHMNLTCRFSATWERLNPDDRKSPIKVFAKDTDGTILFEAGQCDKAYSDEYERLFDKVDEYLNKNFPEWEDASKYWD